MAKKKSVRRSTAKKKPPKKPPVRKAPPRRAGRAAGAKTVRRKLPGKGAASPLGRARVAGDEELDLFFAKDYEARQVFAFLGVTTLKELEEHKPQEIIERLTAPMVQTVNRIRKALALNNRCLAGDQKFAVEFKRQVK
jgi:hypothetical protein